MADESGPASGSELLGLVQAPYGRDAELLRDALSQCGVRSTICSNLNDLIARVDSGRADLLLVSDDAISSGGDDRLLASLRRRASAMVGDILPLILLTGTLGAVHPLTRFPGVTILAKPTRRHILDSAIRAALDTRRRVLKLQTQAKAIEDQNLNLRSMSEELAERNLALAEALETRDRFLATMSHELRTPLNAILSYADLLDLEIDGPLGERQRRHLDRLTLSARHLLELISEILDLAKLAAGKMELNSSAIDLPAEVEAAVTLFRPQAAEKGIDLTIDPPAQTLPLVRGDSLRVRQVLLNLLSNAIKFTTEGGVTIRFRLRDDGAVSALVEDTGIGLTPDEQAKLFTDFFQADSGLTRNHDGAGLGLAISKRLTLLMQGDLAAESEPGRGSVFIFTLPPAT